MYMKDLQRILQNLKLDEKITLEKIGNALGTGKANISWRSKNNSKLKMEEIKKLEKYFNVDLISIIDPHEAYNRAYKFEEEHSEDCIGLCVRGEVNASMGYGITVYDESETGIYHISKKLAKDLMINENLSEIIFVSGDSMYPTIEGGDSLLIDKSKTDIYDGRIYCVRIDGQLYAKRLQKIPPSTIVVVSDNTKYKTFEIDFSKEINYDFAVIGEVKWWGRIAR